MPNALTPAQFEILRRVRDGIPLLLDPRIAGVMREVGFLFATELLQYGTRRELQVTEIGLAYLLAADQEAGRPIISIRRESSLDE